MNFVAASIIGIFLMAFPAMAGAGGASPYGGVDHTKKIKAYNGPSTCMGCHSTSKMGSNLAEDVVNSAHFQLRTPTSFIDMPGGGSHGMLDRACGLPGTTLMANNYAGIATAQDGVTTKGEGCGKCHVAYKPPYKYASVADALPDIDCLRCHADYYGSEWDEPGSPGTNPQPHSRAVVQLPDGTYTWSQDRSLMTAQSVGNLPKAKYCLRCHEHGYTGYKRSTPFEPDTDAHSAAGVECRQCHAMERHKIARGNLVTDGVANDLPNKEVACSSCHGSVPHTLSNAAQLNKHTANVSCEVCHIPAMDVQNNIARRAWAPFTLDPRMGTWESTPANTGGFLYPGFWDAYMDFHPENASPSVRWFDGKASMLAQPFGGYGDRKSNGGCSKLFALKPFTSGMLFDAGWLPGPSSDPTFDMINGTWPFSMKQFYEGNWGKFFAFGFADAQYPTANDYWAARPDMAYMLNMFPMMLQFDRNVYLSEAGVTPLPTLPGPQDGSTYPGIAKAVNIGMGTMAIDMGYFPPGTDPEWAGQFLWSGKFFGMWVPVNMDPSSFFYGELGSFITMSHAIRGKADPLLSNPNYCFTCHYTSDEYQGLSSPGTKRLNYGMLGYPDKDGNGEVDPMWGDYDQPVVKPGVSKIDLAITANRKAETLTITVSVTNAVTSEPLENVTVNGDLTGPASDTGLPKSFSGITGRDGTVTFTYKKTVLDSGNYTFCVKSLTYQTVTEPVSCCSNIIK